MSTTTTTTRTTRKEKKAEDIKSPSVIRDEVKKDLEKKDQRIKELEERVMELKVRKNMDANMVQSPINMNLIRQEMKIADKFIKTVMQTVLPNYTLMKEMEREDMKVVRKTKADKEAKVKEFQSRELDRINSQNCNCSTCVMNKSMSLVNMFKKNNVTSRSFLLSDKVIMAAHYDSLNMYMEVITENDKTRKISFKGVNNNKALVTINLAWRKDNIENMDDIKFNNHMEVSQSVSIAGEAHQVSISAFLVVKAMREMMADPLADLEKNKVMMENQEGSCFVKMYEELTKKVVSNITATKMSDLTEEEEMYMITHFGDMDIHIKVSDGDAMSKKNHISILPFNNSSKTKLYTISTPLLRMFNFFSDGEEEDEFVEVENHNMVDSLSKITKELHMEESSEEDSEEMQIPAEKVYNKPVARMMFSRKGPIIGDFYKAGFKGRNMNKGIESGVLNEMARSELASSFLFKEDHQVPILAVMNMSFDVFLTVAFFSKSWMEFMDLILVKDIEKMRQAMTMSFTMFLDKFCMEISDNKLAIARKYNNFLRTMSISPMFDNNTFKRAFWEYKRRFFTNLMMRAAASEEYKKYNTSKGKSNWYPDNWTGEVCSEFVEWYNKNHPAMELDNMSSIMEFQPGPKVREMKKMLSYKEPDMDIEETNELFDSYFKSEMDKYSEK